MVNLTLILFTLLFSTSTWAQVGPSQAEITSVQLQGAGCDETTAAVSFSPDLQDLSILFDNYILEAGAQNVNIRTLRSELNCQVKVGIRIPRGWSFAFSGVDYRGFADIPRGVDGYQRLIFQNPMSPMVSMREARFRGPASSNYEFSGRQKRLIWSVCGQTHLDITLLSVLGVQYHMRGHYPDALVALDSQDMSLKQSLQIVWRQCR